MSAVFAQMRPEKNETSFYFIFSIHFFRHTYKQLILNNIQNH